jgi:hypothetical protein
MGSSGTRTKESPDAAVPDLVRRRLDGPHPDEDWPEVGQASHAVVQEAKDAGVWIFGGGVERQQATIVGTDGAITDGPVPETKAVIGGFAIIEVSSRAEALDWAARIARGCRCAQEVGEIGYDPAS